MMRNLARAALRGSWEKGRMRSRSGRALDSIKCGCAMASAGRRRCTRVGMGALPRRRHRHRESIECRETDGQAVLAARQKGEESRGPTGVDRQEGGIQEGRLAGSP